MTEFFGLTLILIVALIFVYVAILKPEIRNIILVGLLIRLIMLVAGTYYISLPDSQMDANTLESLAWYWAEDGFPELYESLTQGIQGIKGQHKFDISDNFFSLTLAFPYILFGRSILIPLAMNLLLSMGTIVLGWHIAKKMWNVNIARNLGWIIALYPSIILYSSVTLREVYIWFFLLLAINSIINWSKTNELKHAIFVMINFYILSLYHGPLLLGAFLFLFIMVLHKLKEIYSNTKGRMQIKIKDLFLLSMAFVILIAFLSGNLDIPKLPKFDVTIIFKEIINRSNFSTSGQASYPEWTKYTGVIDTFYKTPLKMILFFGSPFPWEVKSLGHLIIMLDGFFFLFLIFLLLKNLKYIWSNYTLRILLIILIFYSIIFSLGIGNFGTGFRHRTKFLILLLLIVAPYLPKIIISSKIKNK